MMWDTLCVLATVIAMTWYWSGSIMVWFMGWWVALACWKLSLCGAPTCFQSVYMQYRDAYSHSSLVSAFYHQIRSNKNKQSASKRLLHKHQWIIEEQRPNESPATVIHRLNNKQLRKIQPTHRRYLITHTGIVLINKLPCICYASIQRRRYQASSIPLKRSHHCNPSK